MHGWTTTRSGDHRGPAGPAGAADLGRRGPPQIPGTPERSRRSRRGGVKDMVEIRNLDRANLTKAYGLDSQRLLPWPALNAPFEGAWCILRSGDESTQHSHHEYEIFIAMT